MLIYIIYIGGVSTQIFFFVHRVNFWEDFLFDKYFFRWVDLNPATNLVN